MALLLDLLVTGQTRLNDDTYAKDIYADKFIRTGSSDLYVLLGGGGHKLLSDFSMAHSHPYLPLAGGIMTGTISFVDNGTACIRYATHTSTGLGNYPLPNTGSGSIGIFARASKSTDEGGIIISEDTCLIHNSADVGWGFQVHNTDLNQMDFSGTDKAGEKTRTFGIVDVGSYAWSRGGFQKNGSSDSYVLLGGGGHKAVSDFSLSHDHPYLPLTGGTLTNTGNILTLKNSSGGDAALKFDRGTNTAWTIVDTGGNLKFNELTSNTTRLILYESAQSSGKAAFAGDVDASTFNGNLYGGLLAKDILDTQDKVNAFRDSVNRTVKAAYITNSVYDAFSDGLVLSLSVPGTWAQQVHFDDSANVIHHRVCLNGSWGNWAKILDSANYTSYCATADHTHSYLPLSGGWMDTGAQIYFKGLNQSTSVWGSIGYRATSGNGNNAMHTVTTPNNTGALYITTNGYDSENDYGGLAIDNDGVTAFGAGDSGSVFRVINEDNVADGAQFYVTKASGAVVKKSLTASNFVSNVATGTQPYACTSTTVNTNLNADYLDGMHESSFVRWGGYDGTFGTHCPADTVKSKFTAATMPNGNLLAYDTAGDEYTLLMTCRPDVLHGTALKWGYLDRYIRIIRFTNGTAASTDWEKISAGYADSSEKLANKRTLWGQEFDGTNNVSGDMTSVGKMFLNSLGDGTLKIFNSANNHNCGTETVCMQTCFDGADGESHSYTTNYSNRCILSLQPRGGYVGIGHTTPLYKLHVNGNANIGEVLIANPGSTVSNLNITSVSSTVDYLHLYVGSNNDVHLTDRALVIQNGYGNVGIGKTPEYKLDVATSARFCSIVNEFNDEINRYGGPLYIQHRGNIAGSAGDARTGNIIMCANGGSVGIGATSPTHKLSVSGHVSATSYYITNNGTETYNIAQIGNDSTYGMFFEASLATNSSTASKLPIFIGWRGGSSAIYVNSSTDVGIGTNSPLTKLHVNGNMLVNGTMYFNNTANTGIIKYGTFTTTPYRGVSLPNLGTSGIGIFARPSAGLDEGGLVVTEDTCAIMNSSDNGWNFQVIDTDLNQYDYTNSRTFGISSSDFIAWSKGGFSKDGSSDDYVLLGGGGHKVLSSFLKVYKIANSTDVTSLTSSYLYYIDTDSNASTLTNAPYTSSFAMIQFNGYQSGDDIRRYSFALDAYGGAKIFNDRSTNGTGGTWYNVLTSNNYGSYALPLAGGNMVANARIGASGGNLYLGNANNAAWVCVQDLCSQSGYTYWNITQSGTGTFAGKIHAQEVYANKDGSSTGGGVSLYSNSDPMTYGIAFRGTGTYGTHGYITSDWATYFTMNNQTDRGWIFRRYDTNVASIAGNGNMAIGQNLKFSNEAHISTNRSTDYHYGYTFNLEANAQSIGMYSGPAGEAGGVVISPDGCLIYNSSDSGYNLQVRDKDLGSDLTNVATLTFGIEQAGHYAWSRGGFKKNGSDDSYVLLGGGGHKAVSDFATAHSHPYLPLSGGWMDTDAQIYFKGNASSTSIYGTLGFRSTTPSGLTMHYTAAQTKALFLCVNGYQTATDNGGLAIDNDGVTVFGAGDAGSVFRVINEDNVNDGAQFYVTKASGVFAKYSITASSFYESSDERLKDFYNSVDVDLDKLSSLPKKFFKWKSKPNGEFEIGTSAQELQKIYPQLVNTDDKGYLTVAYDKLSIIALRAIDKLYEMNKNLERRIQLLESKR